MSLCETFENPYLGSGSCIEWIRFRFLAQLEQKGVSCPQRLKNLSVWVGPPKDNVLSCISISFLAATSESYLPSKGALGTSVHLKTLLGCSLWSLEWILLLGHLVGKGIRLVFGLCCMLSHSVMLGSMDCSLPDSSAHGIFQGRILEWAAISLAKWSSWPRDQTRISCFSCIGRRVLYHYHHLGNHIWHMLTKSY